MIREALKHTGQSRTGRTIKVEEEDELILAKMDARLIVQVLINLIGNAVKYTPQGTDITVQVKKEKTENSQVIISVCDLGMGSRMIEKKEYLTCFILAVIRWQTAAGA